MCELVWCECRRRASGKIWHGQSVSNGEKIALCCCLRTYNVTTSLPFTLSPRHPKRPDRDATNLAPSRWYSIQHLLWLPLLLLSGWRQSRSCLPIERQKPTMVQRPTKTSSRLTDFQSPPRQSPRLRRGCAPDLGKSFGEGPCRWCESRPEPSTTNGNAADAT
jgi:hypothetical protein